MKITKKVCILLVMAMLAGVVLPFGNLTTMAMEETHFEMDFTNYQGSASKSTAPSGMGLSNFVANQDYVIGEADAAKFISNSKGKFLHVYKSFATSIQGRVALEAKVRFSDTEHERRIFNVNASNFGRLQSNEIACQLRQRRAHIRIRKRLLA